MYNKEKWRFIMAVDYTNEMIINIFNEKIKDHLKNKEDVEKVLEFISTEEFGNTYTEIIKMISDNAIETINEIMYEKVFENRSYSQEFLARQEQKWGKAFIASEAMYICVLESAESYSEFVAENVNELSPETEQIFNALKMIHARSCQVYLEILLLNRNGLADGAYARWRSMYELSIISTFIRNNGNEVASSFLKAADSEDRYEWARKSECFRNYHNKYITFEAIQKQCELATKEWREMYNLSNQIVHASPQGTVYRLGNKTNANVLSVGPSDYGMTIAAIHSAISLSLITTDFFTLYPHGDSMVSMLTFHKWIMKISEYYQATEKECFNDENDLVNV
jgi:hypothetical protein